MDENMVYALVIYDIVSDKRRDKLSKIMNKYGIRVQKSAFEVWITKFHYKKMIKEAQKVADKDADSIRIYKLNYECKQHLIGKNLILQGDTCRWF